MSTGLSEREVELLLQVFRRDPRITEVRLFGSRAQGTHRPSSDIDLAVWGSLNELEGVSLAAELDGLSLPYRFDVVAMAELREDSLREHIERVGQTLFRAEAVR